MMILAKIMTIIGKVHKDSDPVIEKMVAGKITYITHGSSANVSGDSQEGKAITNILLEAMANRAEIIIEKLTKEEFSGELADEVDAVFFESRKEAVKFAANMERHIHSVRIDGKYACLEQLGLCGILELVHSVPDHGAVPHIRIDV